MSIKKLTCAFFLFFFFGTPYAADDIVIHKLKVAANPSVDIRNEDVDRIVKSMNEYMHNSAYTWDSSCNDIHFVRDGNVIVNGNLATSGTFENLSENLKRHAPDANVLVVHGVFCSGVIAAGCGPVGGEPLVAMFLGGDGAYYNPQLWLHERGHNVGLEHSAESPDQDDKVDLSIGKRFMFWMLGRGHYGKTKIECSKFREAKFNSVSISKRTPNILAAAIPPGEVAMQLENVPVSDRKPAELSSIEQLALAAKNEGLTIQAFQVIAVPWVGGAPRAAIASLSEEDLNSIRSLLKRTSSPYISQAVQVLGERGNQDDINLLKKWIINPLPAAIPGDDSIATRDAMRQIKQAKIIAPMALGELARRTQSETAVQILKDVSKSNSNVAPRDPIVNVATQKNALQGLSIVDTEESREYLRKVIAVQNRSPLTEQATRETVDAARAVPLSTEERKGLSEQIGK